MKDKLSWHTKRLLMAEEEQSDGVQEPTLGDAKNSLMQGYSPFDGFDSDLVTKEIDALIKEHGIGMWLTEFLTKQDWTERAEENRKKSK